jgi:hypothetical protein
VIVKKLKGSIKSHQKIKTHSNYFLGYDGVYLAEVSMFLRNLMPPPSG